jgi:hypothetical protein
MPPRTRKKTTTTSRTRRKTASAPKNQRQRRPHPLPGLERARPGELAALNSSFTTIPRPSREFDPPVSSSVDKIGGQYSGKDKSAQTKIDAQGFSASVEKVTKRLARSGLDDATRLVISDPRVYGALVLDAIDRDKIKPDDPTGLYNAVRRRAQGPRQAFQDQLVKNILTANKVTISDALRKRVVKRVDDEGVPLAGRQAEDAVLAIYRDVVAEGELPEAVEEFAKLNEIPPAKFTQPVKDSMVRYLQGLGLTGITAADVKNRDKYDEYFAVAYDRATAVADGRSDPIVLSRPAGDVEPWDFQVDTFESADEQGVIKENILAAGALDYVYYLGDVLGVYKLTDTAVLNWAAGALDIADTDTSQQLYRYWKVRDDRMSPEERGMLYKRVLNKGDTDVLSKMVVNDGFPTLWDNLMQEVAAYIQATADAAQDASVSRVPIYRAIQELQYNLTEFMTGMAHMQVTEMYAQLKDAMTLLGSNDIVSQMSGGRRKNVWAVIAYVAKQELGVAPDVSAIRTLAVDGNRVFQGIANFTPGGFSDGDFQDFLDAAQAWILAAASVGDTQPVGVGAEQNGYRDDFSGDFKDDLSDDWDA